MKNSLAAKILSSFVLLFAVQSKAQIWGAGVYGGMQGCSGQVSAGDGAESERDAYLEIKQAIENDKKELREKEKQQRTLRDKVKAAVKVLNPTLKESVSTVIYNHIDNQVSCVAYKGVGEEDEKGSLSASGVEKPDSIDLKDFPGGADAFRQICTKGSKGKFNVNSVCKTPEFLDPDVKKSAGLSIKCASSLNDYQTSTKELSKLDAEVELMKAQISENETNLKSARERVADAIRQAQRERVEGGCVECMASGSGYVYKKQEPDWANVMTNVGLGVLGTYMGYQSNKMVAQYNSQLGWPTQSIPAWGYGFPYLAAGLYGALGGGTGQGAFGCAGGMGGTGGFNGANGMMGPFGMNGLYGNNSGAFGYPQGMLGGSLGGGMYLPGMGPWGMNGPGGMGGMMGGYPGMGMMAGMGIMSSGYPGMGMMAGNGMMAGYPGMGMMASAGMMGGYPGMGMMAGAGMMGGYPGMGMMAGGGAMAGYPGMGMMASAGMMGGYPGMGMMAGAGAMGGYPGMGMMAGAGMMGGYPGMGMMAGAGMMGGYPGMGMMAGAGMMSGYPGMGMMTGMGMMSGYPGMGMMNGMDNSASMQMQQQMMQLQMQQQQAMMQQQQRAQENAMAKQRVVSSLSQEMYSLQMRIQQVMMGYDSSNSSTGGYYQGYLSGGYNGGSNYTPYNNNNNYNQYNNNNNNTSGPRR